MFDDLTPNHLPQHLKDGVNIVPDLGNKKCSAESCIHHAIFTCYSDRDKSQGCFNAFAYK